MSVETVTEIEIYRPRSEVAAYACDPAKATSWYENIKRVKWDSSKPFAVGTRMDFEAEFMRRTISYTYEVTEWVPEERFVMRTAQGPFPMETTYTFSDAGNGGTRMTLENRGKPSGFGKISAPLMSAAVRKANRKDLARLKSILEEL